MLLITLLSVIISYATQYTVTANVLNLRTAPSTTAPVGTTAVKGEYLNVVTVDGDWATIEKNGKTYYGSIKYLTLVVSGEPEGSNDFMTSYIIGKTFHVSIPDNWRYRSDIPLYIALILIVGFMLIHFFGDAEIYEDNEGLFYGGVIAFVCLCLLELVHFCLYDGDATWFCSGGLGWIWTIVNFILYGLCCYIQIVTFIKLTSAFHYHGNRYCSNVIGYILTGIAMLAYLVTCLFYPAHSNTVLILGIVTLVGWFIWMFSCNARDGGSWINLLGLIMIWLLGVAATFIMSLFFVVVSAIIIIGLVIIYAVFGNGENRKSSGSGSFFNIFEDSSNTRIARDRESHGSLRDSEGNSVDVTFSNGGNKAYADDFSGRKFRKTITGDFEEYE